MSVSLIWAMAEDGVIGLDNALPWKLPADMKWFRRHTLGKPVVMGRKTFESFGARPLPERTNIVVTRDPDYRVQGAVVVHDVDAALAAAGAAEEVMVIGGARFYAAMLPRAERLYVTLVHGRFEGDAHFPDLDWSAWREVAREERAADERNAWPMSFRVYERVR